MSALPPGFSVEAFAKETAEGMASPDHAATLAAFGHALLEALAKARASAGSAPYRGKPLEPKAFSTTTAALWKLAGAIGGMNLPWQISSARHYQQPAVALTFGVDAAGAAMGKCDLELFEAALDFFDEAQRIHRRRQIAAGIAGLVT